MKGYISKEEEYISKEDFLKKFRYGEADTEDEKVWCATFRRMIKEQPTVTKADICREFAEKIKNEIKDLKSKQQSINTDYYTGYMSALSTIEGFVAETEEE